jgi:RNA polymerase-binding protein DksA
MAPPPTLVRSEHGHQEVERRQVLEEGREEESPVVEEEAAGRQGFQEGPEVRAEEGRAKEGRAKRPARKAPRKAAKKKRSGKKPARKKAGTARAASSSKVARKAVRGARRDKAFFDHFRARLLEERERIVRRLEGLRDELSGLQEMPRELEEWAQEEKDRDILIRLEERESVELRRIQAALERIDDGSYGLCQICGRSIPRDRLEELPTAFRCIEHSG